MGWERGFSAPAAEPSKISANPFVRHPRDDNERVGSDEEWTAASRHSGVQRVGLMQGNRRRAARGPAKVGVLWRGQFVGAGGGRGVDVDVSSALRAQAPASSKGGELWWAHPSSHRVIRALHLENTYRVATSACPRDECEREGTRNTSGGWSRDPPPRRVPHEGGAGTMGGRCAIQEDGEGLRDEKVPLLLVSAYNGWVGGLRRERASEPGKRGKPDEPTPPAS
jgi:hypothetical protein